MGGRGSAGSAGTGFRLPPNVMTEEQYVSRFGGSVMSDYMLDKTRIPHGQTARQNARMQKEAEQSIKANAKARELAREEYKSLVRRGELRPPTRIEQLLQTAHGNPDNESVVSARRLLDRRGYDWRTGRRKKK